MSRNKEADKIMNNGARMVAMKNALNAFRDAPEDMQNFLLVALLHNHDIAKKHEPDNPRVGEIEIVLGGMKNNVVPLNVVH